MLEVGSMYVCMFVYMCVFSDIQDKENNLDSE